MRLRSSTGVFAALLAGLLAQGAAQAHAVLLDPPPRDPNQIKVFPCGGAGPTAAGGAQRTVLQAGSTITVEFNEFVQHPGYFRVAFSDNGVDGFDQHVLVPMIADTNNAHYTVQVPLPNTPCDNCSIQLIQCMDGSLPPTTSCSNYYSCADVILEAAGGGGGAADAGPPPAPGEPDAAPPPPGSPDAGADPGSGAPQAGTSGPVAGGCSIAGGGGSHSSGPLWLLLPLIVALPRLARRVKS